MSQQQDHKNLYREIVTNLLEGVMVNIIKGKTTMLNPAAEQMLGLTQEDMGDSFVNVFLPERRRGFLRLLSGGSGSSGFSDCGRSWFNIYIY